MLKIYWQMRIANDEIKNKSGDLANKQAGGKEEMNLARSRPLKRYSVTSILESLSHGYHQKVERIEVDRERRHTWRRPVERDPRDRGLKSWVEKT